MSLRRALFAYAIALAALLPASARAQIQPGGSVLIDKTPIVGGTTGRCLYDNAGKIGETASCGLAGGITVGTSVITGGTTTRVLYDNAGVLGEYTNTQLTALINPATASLSGALPAWPNNTTTFFRGDGTYQTLNCAALTNGASGGCAMTYAEGSWTPTVTTDGTVGAPAYSTQNGTYERVGRSVTARFTIALSGWTGSPTGNVSIAGLPLTSTGTAFDNGSCFISLYVVTGLAASNFGIVGRVSPSSTTAALQSAGSAVTSNLTAAQAGTTANFIGVCFYHV